MCQIFEFDFMTNHKLRNHLHLLLFMLVLFISNNGLSQGLTPDAIRNIKVNELTNEQVLKIKDEMNKQNLTMPMLENLAITNGMSATDFATLKTRIEAVSPKVNETNIEKAPEIKEEVMEFDKNAVKNKEIFGSEIFTNASLSFEPNSNMLTPPSYVLGPGDEMQVVIFGLQEYSGEAVVSKEGKIVIPSVGQVFVNGLTFEAARVQIKKACSKIYSSLASGGSQVSISLTKIRTIRVTIIGVKKPGNYSISSLSTVFNALHVAGGPSENGSYRKIEVVRGNKVIRTIDLYKFLTKGDQTDNINLLENDVIRVPVYENRVKIEGNVKRPGIFEMLPGESVKDLMLYCGGFDEAAYRKNIKIVNNSLDGLKVIDVDGNDFLSYQLQVGDVIKVGALLNKLENKVSVKGSVNRPDDYEFVEGMKISDLIAKADGFTQDAFLNRALLIREKEDLTKEIENLNLTTIQNGANDLMLRKNDELIISSIFDFKSQHTVKITGQVKNNGDYPYIEKMTLYDLIVMSGGFTDGASKTVEVSRQIIKDEKIKNQMETSVVKTIDIDTLLMDQARNIELAASDVVAVRKKPVFEIQKTIDIQGQVMFPGFYVLAKVNDRILDLLDRAGGILDNADKNSIYVLRLVDNNLTTQVETSYKKIPIEYELIRKNPGLNRNIVLKPGDRIVVGKLDNTVKVLGQVYLPTELPYVRGKNLKYYLKSVGGLGDNANKKKIYVVKPNGLAVSTTKFLGIKRYPKVVPGAQINVPALPSNADEKRLTTSELAIIGSAISSLTATVVAIINLTK